MAILQQKVLKNDTEIRDTDCGTLPKQISSQRLLLKCLIWQVPMRFALRIPGDGRFTQRHLASKGTFNSYELTERRTKEEMDQQIRSVDWQFSDLQ